jgi:subtilase family protein
MAKQRRRSGGGNDRAETGPTGVSYPPAERELVVMADPDIRLRATSDGIASQAEADIGSLAEFLADESIALEPLFGISEDRLEWQAAQLSAAAEQRIPDLTPYYRVRAPDTRLDDLAKRLAELPTVMAAYVKPATEPAAVLDRDDVPVTQVAPPATPDFSARQGYLRPAPEGVDADWAHTQPGGIGTGVQIVDVEGAWQLSHEDLLQNMSGVIAGTPTNDLSWRNHGTAVFGEFGGDVNGLGIVGISPAANARGASIFPSVGSAGAIRAAADHLNAGDIILIELHRPGPRHGFAQRLDQAGYIAVEWWPDDFAAIRYAVARGVIVVEAAGNGAENLSDALYDQPGPGFPSSWQNPFNVANPSSEAVMVGAGAPPPGTHGRDHGPDRSRLDFSNYGARVDAQGWGREVTTTGGRGPNPGDLQDGSDETVWYTDTFSGTSSASPIVVGALASIQGILDARGLARLTPARAIDVLRTTGSPQTDAPGRPATQRIGNRPDIRAAIAALAPAVVSSGIATQYWNECLAYPPGDTASLWLFVGDAWRHLDNPDPSTLDMVQRAFLGQDSRVRVWYTSDQTVGLVVEGS